MDKQQDDTQMTGTNTAAPVKSSGQVMDVTAPNKQIDVSEALSEEEEPTADTAPENTVDTSAEPGDTPEVGPEPENEETETETEAEATGPSPETESPEAAEPEYAPVHEPEATGQEPEPATSISVADADAAEPTPDAPATEAASDEPPADTQQPTNPPPQTHMPAKGGTPVVAIIVAIIVAIALAGLVIFTYLKGKNTAIKRSTSDTSSQTVVSKPQASAGDVDTTSQEIDTSLQKADDTKDFPTTDLSDTTLGL